MRVALCTTAARVCSDRIQRGQGAPHLVLMANPIDAIFRRHLVENHAELMRVLMQWDEDGDGCISAKEFRQGCRVLILDADLPRIPREILDEVYEEMDLDATGNIPFEQLELALPLVPIPDGPGLEVFEEEIDDDEKRDTFYVLDAMTHVRGPHGRVRRRSKSLPSSPRDTSPSTGRRPPSDSNEHHFPQISPSTSRYRPPKYIQPPRRTNLPRLNTGAEANSPDARSTCGQSQAQSSACSRSSTMTSALSPEERKIRRARRETELSARMEKHRLPGRNVPGVGQYTPYNAGDGSIERRAAHARTKPSAWSHRGMPQHQLYDSLGNRIDFSKRSFVGPGRYVSHQHDIATRQEKAGSIALSFWSAVPQREPAGKRF